jgi:hypothetical protein
MKYTINTNIDSFKIVINKFIITRYRLQSIYYAYYVKKINKDKTYDLI